MGSLKKKIALVTGVSRGVGKGVALGLGEAGATVYVTGRTVEPGNGPMGLPGTIQETAEDVNSLGGIGIPVHCDHTDDHQVEALFDQIDREQGKLDVLANSVWGGYERMFDNNEFTWPYPFWRQPMWRWDAMFHAGVRAHYVASTLAAKRMSFVKDIVHDSESKAIVKAIIAMAHNLDLKVIAEGIETEQQCIMLQEYGCDFMQGYYFYRCLPGEDIVNLVRYLPDMHYQCHSVKK